MEASASPVPSGAPGKAAVIVAHPGHELMVYHWLERHRPLYFCLTEGSGGSAAPRLESTNRLLQQVGARPGRIFGRYPDREVYRLLLDGRVDVFVRLAQELADALIEAGVDFVAGDAVEGFNPVHDVCRFVIDGAAARVRRRTGRVLGNYDFVLDSRPDTCPEPLRAGARWLRLDEAALQRKLAAALGYPELRAEVRAASLRFGTNAFAVECLRPAATPLLLEQFENEVPAYERYGQIRGRAGLYREIIRYRQHVLPVRAALAEEGGMKVRLCRSGASSRRG
jgi:hypothetical protein